MLKDVLTGTAAGAAGTVALDAATYMDMAIRGRPSSETPAGVAGALAQRLGVQSESVMGGGEQAQHRRSGLGALLGYVTGLTIGTGYGALRSRLGGFAVPVAGAVVGLAAMVASDTPAVALKQTDPRSWGVSGWLADLVPHLVYGYVTVLTFEAVARAMRSPVPAARHWWDGILGQ